MCLLGTHIAHRFADSQAWCGRSMSHSGRPSTIEGLRDIRYAYELYRKSQMCARCWKAMAANHQVPNSEDPAWLKRFDLNVERMIEELESAPVE